MINKRVVLSVFMTAVIVMSLFGCSKSVEGEATTQETTAAVENNTATATDYEMFTQRDYEGTYDESSAVMINLDDNNSSCTSQNVEISGCTVKIKADGTYILTGSLSNGQVQVDAQDLAKVQLVLRDVNINCDTSAAIYVKQADKVFITVDEGSSNTLSNKKDFVSIDDNNIDSVIFAKSDLTVNGNGALTVNAKYGHGIVTKKDLKITSGNCDVNAADSALQGKNSVRIAGGNISLTAAEDGIHSENSDDADKGFVYIIGGAIEISSGDDGIHAGKDVTVKGGAINISKSNEGIEGQTIAVSGGEISINSEDDGINASSGSSSDTQNMGEQSPFSSDESCNITISGGTVRVNADGDGIDSNGSINVTGGEIYVEGPTNSGNGALDYGSSASISGGIVVAIGSSGMAENFSDAEQGVILANISGSSGDTVKLNKADGTELLYYKAGKTFDCVLVSCPEITTGEAYILICGNQETEITMTDLIYGSSGMNFGGNNMGKGPNGRGNSMGGGPGMGKMG